MIDQWMLELIDMYLRKAFPEHNNELFGSRSVIMLSNFGQLPLMLNLFIYINTSWDLLFNNDFIAYKLFQKVYELDVV